MNVHFYFRSMGKVNRRSHIEQTCEEDDQNATPSSIRPQRQCTRFPFSYIDRISDDEL